MADESDDPLAWASDIEETSEEPLPPWAEQNGFERSGRTCARCHGELLERRKIAYTGRTDSFIMVRCENYDHGCDFQNEISPGFDGA